MWPPIPLTEWAQRQLDPIASDLPQAADLLGERSRPIPGGNSAGGGCRWWRCRNGWLALNLARAEDAKLLPALLGEIEISDLEHEIARQSEVGLVARGRTLGMALAGLSETPVSPAIHCTQLGAERQDKPLKVLDLSALWAGPLATRLLRLAGAEVTRVVTRADPTEHSDPAHFALLNEGKPAIEIDLESPEGRSELLERVRMADTVIEAARPRALKQLGIDADAIVAAQPDLLWLTITGHGVAGEAANWVGFGDDAAVAGGLSRELQQATGKIGFVGDAMADPLTGILAARFASEAGTGGRHILSMSGVVAQAIAETKSRDTAGWRQSLRDWAKALSC